jgi:hypothetical protein
MGSVVNLEVKQSRHAVEQTIFGLCCDTQALARLANDGSYFMDLEVMEMRKAAYELISVANQVEAAMKNGSK